MSDQNPPPHPDSAEDRSEISNSENLVLWIHGRSGAGKTTLAGLLADELGKSRPCVILDGDVFRRMTNSDLGFDADSRRENIRRAATAAQAQAALGSTVIAAFETPTQELRALARSLVIGHRFVEIALVCSLECCRGRDPKGLYAAAQAGCLWLLSGVDAPWEPSTTADVTLDTEKTTPSAAAMQVMNALRDGTT